MSRKEGVKDHDENERKVKERERKIRDENAQRNVKMNILE